MAHPSSSLPDFIAELDAWARANAGAVETETVPYGDDPDQLVDLYRPAAGSLGTVLVLHGGFWRPEYDRSTTVAVSVALAARGWTAANAEYRRSPGGWREMLGDVLAAAWAVGPDVALGHSAGGHLALWVAARAGLARAVALGAVCDLRSAAEAGLGDCAAQAFLGGEPDVAADAYAEADPAGLVPLGAAQVLIHGTEDDRVPLEQARAHAARATTAGDDCRLVELPGVDHFDVIDPRHPAFEHVVAALR